MGGKSDQGSRLQDGYNRGYSSYQAGVDPRTIVGPKNSNLNQAYLSGWEAAANTPQPEAGGFDGVFEMFGGMMEAMARQRDEAAAKQSQLDEQYRAEQERAMGLAELDKLFSTKLDAANRATTEVEKQVGEEMAHAATRGIDYAITPEQKTERINNLFADYWSEGQEASIADYGSKYGTDKHVWKLPVVRGTGKGSEGALAQEGAKAGGKVTKGGPGTATVLTEEEKPKDTTVLGG